MALTLLTNPNIYHPINSRTILAVESTNVNEPKFQYQFILSIYEQPIGTYYIDPDPEGYGIFDCGPRLRPFIHADVGIGPPSDPANTAIFEHPDNKLFIKAWNGATDIWVEINEVYADDIYSEPYVRGSFMASDTFIAYGGSTLPSEGFNYTDGKGILEDASSQFLIENSWPVSRGYQKTLLDTDRYALAFFKPVGDEFISYFKITMDALFGTAPTNIGLQANKYGWESDYNQYMFYFCCGPMDLVTFTSLNAGQKTAFEQSIWNSYTVQAFDIDNNPISAIYTFHRNKVACRYDKYQLMFTNRHGSWNFQTFYLMPNTKVSVSQGKEIVRQIGRSQSSVVNGYNFNAFEREVVSYGKDPILSYELQSDWLNEYEAKDLESFIYSKDVYVIINGGPTPVPVIVSNRMHQHDKYKKLRQYKVTIEVAQKYHLL
jgi:hypothetical protein